MHVQVKMITGVWANTDTRSPLQFQFVADPTKSWKDIVLSELRVAIRNLQPTKVSIDGYYANPHENVTAEVVLKDGTKIPFDVPVFKDALTACHPHTLFYNGNRYVIDIMPNKDNPAHKEKYRGVIRRCNGTEHPIFVYGNILTFC